MNPPTRRIKGCVKRYQGSLRPKVKHETLEDALEHLRRSGTDTSGVYLCPACNYFHVGRAKVPGSSNWNRQFKREDRRLEAMVGQLIRELKIAINGTDQHNHSH